MDLSNTLSKNINNSIWRQEKLLHDKHTRIIKNIIDTIIEWNKLVFFYAEAFDQ